MSARRSISNTLDPTPLFVRLDLREANCSYAANSVVISIEKCIMDALACARMLKRFRFRLRTFFIGITLMAITLSASISVLRPWYMERSKIEIVKKMNAQVFTEPRGQFLLRQFIGDRFSERSVYLHLDDPRVDDAWLKQIGPMQHIEVLSIKSPNLTDIGLKELASWPNLQSLNLVDTQVTDPAIVSLRELHPSLRFVESRQTEP